MMTLVSDTNTPPPQPPPHLVMNSSLAQEDTGSTTPPPPYTFNSTRQETNQSTDTQRITPSNQPDFSLLDLNLFETCKSTTSYYSSCVIEDRFLLLGHSTDGLQVVDLKALKDQQKPKTIIWIQARQLKLLSSCGLLLVLPDRMKKVRCYSLSAIVRLCYGVLELEWTSHCTTIYPLGNLHTWWQHTSSSSSSSSSSTTSTEQLDSTITSSLSTSSSKPLVTLNGSLRKRYMWENKVALEDFCYKLPNTKDAISIHLYQTSGYVFVAILQRDRILLWQQQRNQQRPLTLLKEFWIPAEAQTISFADDRVTLRHIVAVFPHGASLISIQNSKVKTVPIDAKLEQLYQAACFRQQYAYHGLLTTTNHQNHPSSSPSSISTTRFTRSHSTGMGTSSRSDLPFVSTSSSSTSSSSSSSTTTTLASLASSSRRPLSFNAPSLQWTSLIQLPFYPDGLASLTMEFSIPPSYDTVMTRTPFEATDAVAVPSMTAPQLFFATFGCHSMIIDMNGVLFSTQVYSWPDPPDGHIAFLPLRPNDWYAVGFAKESVNVMHMTSATSQRIMAGVTVRYLGQSGDSLIWSCIDGKSNQVYSLSRSSSLE
ncbi:uncharacterized protein BX664DRAFT_384435 [Halteromyces radiatus]|uniref:uncharacterized protein n=1 Tax=Halteromyces radiatus TaxID=101107 RepID=UPI00221ED033|nr:uncharacterized protein BX664DRAFT_384435 [Halteromyces radiatus]KAI8092936.1 hypothetical protein BX664DRAFT_384435 [Halteromyces radiatus]